MFLSSKFLNRLVATLLAIVATLSTALAADSGTGWSYDSKTKTLTLSGSEVAWSIIKAFDSTTENVVFADDYNVSNLPSYAFYLFRKLKTVKLPNVVTSIGSYAFTGCFSLESVEILSDGTSDSKHVIYLGDSTDQTSTGYLNFPRNQATLIYNPNTTWIGDNENQNLRYYFSDFVLSGGTGWSYDSKTKTLTLSGSEVAWSEIGAYSSTTENVVFAEDYSVSDIPANAFYEFTKLTSVDLPNVVESIGEQAFYGCTSLASITLPEGLTSIGQEAFYGCSALTSVSLPSCITSIDEWVFGNCTSLATVTLPRISFQ